MWARAKRQWFDIFTVICALLAGVVIGFFLASCIYDCFSQTDAQTHAAWVQAVILFAAFIAAVVPYFSDRDEKRKLAEAREKAGVHLLTPIVRKTHTELLEVLEAYTQLEKDPSAIYRFPMRSEATAHQDQMVAGLTALKTSLLSSLVAMLDRTYSYFSPELLSTVLITRGSAQELLYELERGDVDARIMEFLPMPDGSLKQGPLELLNFETYISVLKTKLIEGKRRIREPERPE